MKPFCAVLLILSFLAACQPRVSVYSPRRERTEAHLQARTVADCLECHDVARLRLHQADDNCFRCHKICEAY